MLINTYGGGPTIRRKDLDIYSEDLEIVERESERKSEENSRMRKSSRNRKHSRKRSLKPHGKSVNPDGRE